tara:strand:- start:746 stop:976 length:231 start_codon:yes stop_codon:yes gene_type:complete
MDYSEAFEKWMIWEENSLNIDAFVKQPNLELFDSHCKTIGVDDLIRRRNIVRFKNKEDMAFVKLMLEKGSFNNFNY